MDAKSKFLGTGKIIFGSIEGCEFVPSSEPIPVESFSWMADHDTSDEGDEPVSLATTRECHLTLEWEPDDERKEFFDHMLRDIEAAWHEYLLSNHKTRMAILRVGNYIYAPNRLIVHRPTAVGKSACLDVRYRLATEQLGEAARKTGTELHHAMQMISRIMSNRLTPEHFELKIGNTELFEQLQADLLTSAKKRQPPFWAQDWRNKRKRIK